MAKLCLFKTARLVCSWRVSPDNCQYAL